MATTPARAPSGRTFFGHPWGLATLFFTEMWERFSFYGMRGILVLFLIAPPSQSGLGLAEGTAKALLGVYMAMVYFAALPGGWVADRLLGARRTVLAGCAVIMCGHVAMAVPAGPGPVYLGLALIILGSGLLKPNISTMVGRLYAREDDARRDSAFSLFYLGVNIGALAPFVVGYLGENVNWHLGFGAAAAGMALGLTQYVLGTRHLRGVGDRPGHRLTPDERRRLARAAVAEAAAAAIYMADAAVLLDGITVDDVTVALTVLAVAVPVAYFAYLFRSREVTAEERRRLRAYVWLFAAAALFWMIYDQAAGPLNIFAARSVDLTVFGRRMPASWTQNINPIMIICLSGFFAWLWLRLGDRVSIPQKFAFGLVMCGLSFAVMSAAAHAAAGGARVSLLWLVAVYLLQTVGELALSPVGLSVTVKLAPRAFAGQLLGVWFLAVACGDALGGQVARLQDVVGGVRYFLLLGAVTVAAGAAMFAFARTLSRLAGQGGDREPSTAAVP
ncbi:oligopeptide:H+ symporter [Actinomadura keratinilytica]|uniref:MFS transporter n=1 Tax=Actinomadura keratinilytica TaxID=547461 RepID=A0ABP7ZD52_9ACTN